MKVHLPVPFAFYPYFSYLEFDIFPLLHLLRLLTILLLENKTEPPRFQNTWFSRVVRFEPEDTQDRRSHSSLQKGIREAGEVSGR
jgi:hypothetical protein